MSELQIITDSLAQRIRRPVNFDDPEMRLLTHSVQAGDIDSGRLATILQRRVPEKVIAWVRSLRVADATGLVRLPANPELGTLARICVPIRWHGTLLGYLWVIDADSSLTAEDLDVVNSSAEAAGSILYRESLREQLERGRERELLRDLLSDAPDFRRYAADELVKEDLFVEGITAVLVARPVLAENTIWDDDLQLVVMECLDQLRRSRPPRRSLQLVRPDQAVFVLSPADRKRGSEEVQALGRRLYAMMMDRASTLGLKGLLVGIGEQQHSLQEVVRSYHQALQAARVAESVAAFGPVVEWSRLGIYQLLSQFPMERITSDALPLGLVTLLKHSRRAWLVETLERYLDNGGDAQATANDLALHRASLYYRLQKIEEIASVDLRRGEDRLILHLGLKLARLAGILPHYSSH